MDQKTVIKLFDYSPTSGEFLWKKRDPGMFKRVCDSKTWNTKYAGKTCGTVDGKGYLHVNYCGKFYRLHRLAWLYIYGTQPPMIDHINRDITDNRIENLRSVTHEQNNLNRSANKNAVSKYKGVSRHTHGRWQAQTKIKGVHHHLGLFDTEEEASSAYINFMTKTHGTRFFSS